MCRLARKEGKKKRRRAHGEPDLEVGGLKKQFKKPMEYEGDAIEKKPKR